MTQVLQESHQRKKICFWGDKVKANRPPHQYDLSLARPPTASRCSQTSQVILQSPQSAYSPKCRPLISSGHQMGKTEALAWLRMEMQWQKKPPRKVSMWPSVKKGKAKGSWVFPFTLLMWKPPGPVGMLPLPGNEGLERKEGPRLMGRIDNGRSVCVHQIWDPRPSAHLLALVS